MRTRDVEFLKRYPKGVQLHEDAAVRVDVNDGKALFVTQQPFSITGLTARECKSIQSLNAGLSNEDLESHLGSRRMSHLLCLLHDQGNLKAKVDHETTDSLFSRQNEWLSHFVSCPDELSKLVSRKRILILGCGGTGSVIAMHLARSGIQNFHLVDGGVIDLPDLNRQLPYDRKDLGVAKVDALQNYLEAIHPTIQIGSTHLMIDKVGSVVELGDFDLIINCIDKPEGRIQKIVADAAIEMNTPVLFGAVGVRAGTVGPFLTTNDGKRGFGNLCDRIGETWSQHKSILKSSICFTNSLIAVQMAFEAFLYLAGLKSEKDFSYEIDFLSGARKEVQNWSGL